MFVLIPVEAPSIDASRDDILVIEQILDLVEGNTEFGQRMRDGVPGHKRLAGSQAFGGVILDGLGGKLLPVGIVERERHLNDFLFVRWPVVVVEGQQVIAQGLRGFCLQHQRVAFPLGSSKKGLVMI